MITRRKQMIIGGAAAIVLALLFLPIASVTATTSPQPAPAQACPAMQSLQAVGSWGARGFNTTVQSQGVSVSFAIQNFSGGGNPQQEYFYLGDLAVSGTNDSNGHQVLYLAADSASLFIKRDGASSFDLQLSIPSFAFHIDRSLAQKYHVSITSLYIYKLNVYLVLDCQNGTLQTTYTAQTSAASLLQGYLQSRGVRF